MLLKQIKQQRLLISLIIYILVIVFSAVSFAQTVEVGTFNIRWFGTDAETDMDMLFQTIKDTGVDVLGVEEIEKTTMFGTLAKEKLGPTWEFKYAQDNSRQKVGLLYNTSEVEAIGFVKYPEIDISGYLRPAYRGYFKAKNGDFDFHVIVLHLDSGDDESDIANRDEQWARLAAIVSNLNNPPNEKDIIVVGDMNCFNENGEDISELDAFQEETGFQLVTASVPFTHWYKRERECSRLDHILISPDVVEFTGDVKVSGACATGDCEDSVYFKKVSDHCPVVASFSVISSDVTSPIAAELQEVIGNIRTKIYHHPDSPSVPRIKPENKVELESKEEAEEAGYRAARNWDW